MKNINFDVNKFNMLKKAYNKAVSDGEKQFSFEGEVLLVDYAKYMIQYLSKSFG